MYQQDRLLMILEYLNKNNSMSVHDICEQLNVSRDTARRDILKLIEQGAAMRTHGGISLPVLESKLHAYKERMDEYSENKKNIALKALTFIHDNEHYFFDVSTNIRFLAEIVNKRITVFTHSLDNIEILAEKDNVDISTIGGCLNKRNRFFYKPGFAEILEGILFDAAFLGAAAITSDGIFYDDEEDAFIKRSIVKQSGKVIILSEGQKFQKRSYYKGVGWEQIDIFISDSVPPAWVSEIMESNDIQLIIV
ncbi:MAG: DeoR/GlpR family DNA-binding transcription regulator [Clostridiaceae bacterium]